MRIDSSHPARPPYCLQSAHVIRLRGPWHWEILPPSDPPPASLAATARANDHRPATFQAPDGLSQVLAATPAGHLRLSRLFRCPTGLDGGSTVELVIQPIAARGVVRLNSVPLGPLGPSVRRFPITEYLQDTNELQLQLQLDRDRESIAGQETAAPRIDVRLEIV